MRSGEVRSGRVCCGRLGEVGLVVICKVLSGRYGEVEDGAVWSYQAWQARLDEARRGLVW
jgi:hypothetical protein